MVEEGHRLTERGKIDFQLVQAARSGKQLAYADLMDRYRDSIYYMMLKMVKHPDDADLNIYDVLVDDTILQIFGCDLVGGMDGIFDYKLGKKDETR